MPKIVEYSSARIPEYPDSGESLARIARNNYFCSLHYLAYIWESEFSRHPPIVIVSVQSRVQSSRIRARIQSRIHERKWQSSTMHHATESAAWIRRGSRATLRSMMSNASVAHIQYRYICSIAKVHRGRWRDCHCQGEGLLLLIDLVPAAI